MALLMPGKSKYKLSYESYKVIREATEKLSNAVKDAYSEQVEVGLGMMKDSMDKPTLTASIQRLLGLATYVSAPLNSPLMAAGKLVREAGKDLQVPNTITEPIAQLVEIGIPGLDDLIVKSVATGVGAMGSIKVLHGTGKKFSNFDLQYVGSGEGNQAFGYGFYFTSKEGIARSYAEARKRVSGFEDVVIDRNLISPDTWKHLKSINATGAYDSDIIEQAARDIQSFAHRNVTSSGDTIQEIANGFSFNMEHKSQLIHDIEDNFDNYVANHYERMSESQKRLGFPKPTLEQSKQQALSTLKLYKEELEYDNTMLELFESGAVKIENPTGPYIMDVTLHAGKTPDKYDYLDWYNQPTSEQVEKISKLVKSDKLKNRSGQMVPISEMSGQEIYTLLGSDKRVTSLDLLSVGIDGIKYPTESLSKGASAKNVGTNYVVFDASAITIDAVRELR